MNLSPDEQYLVHGMGFPEGQVRRAMEQSNSNKEEAIELILTGQIPAEDPAPPPVAPVPVAAPAPPAPMEVEPPAPAPAPPPAQVSRAAAPPVAVTPSKSSAADVASPSSAAPTPQRSLLRPVPPTNPKIKAAILSAAGPASL
jgi:hypothetical protein